ncbi:MAG TPA: hypothetical protein PLD27_12760 [bacterium]|mgnify:CR=1 FL=1|nr:hypothetical protein [bacterium]HOL48740.1 hypothetical protein [bacterium]HPQ20061.1 hypothetical protein [bacterium]
MIEREQIKEKLKNIQEPILNHHLMRLDDDYFEQFDLSEIEQHLNLILSLNSEKLCDLIIQPKDKKVYYLTIIGFDFPGLFSIISGLLTLYNLNIQTGKIFTYKRCTQSFSNDDADYYIKRKKIIDWLEIINNNEEELDEQFRANYVYELNNYLLLVQKRKYNEVRKQLQKRIANFLFQFKEKEQLKLMPIKIEIENEDNWTILHITGEDTPAFLFSLSNALAIKGISIHKIYINTIDNKVNDILFITDRYERPITNTDYLNNLKIAVSLIKQFTLLLPFASDPSLAIEHFEQLIDAVLLNKTQSFNLLDINNEIFLTTLAKLVGSSNYLWEEFIRLQYENFLPILKRINELKKIKTKKEIEIELEKLLAEKDTLVEKMKVINSYKDKELFRIDLAHLIYHTKTFIEFSEALTNLAEVIISKSIEIIYNDLKKIYGEPKIINTESKSNCCKFGIFGLGKFGGIELGYASDIEIVLIYEDIGFTDNTENSISNPEFFILIIQNLVKYIEAKQTGIFQIDLRLRPYGNKGPLASSFNKWYEYYLTAKSFDYEKQSLIKLRPICGDNEFLNRVMQAREEILFSDKPISFENTIELRRKQIEMLVKPDEINVKFSEGGLNDVEYSIQFLQLLYGSKYKELRTQNILKALDKLLEFNIITPTAYEKLYNAYTFLRRLINALRMVKGNANDLVIPPVNSDEFTFLARRMGYVTKNNISPETQLKEDLDNVLKTGRTFFEKKFIEKKDKVFEETGMTEIIVFDVCDKENIKKTLTEYKFNDIEKVHNTIIEIKKIISDKKTLASVLVLAKKYIINSPDPDKVIIYFEKYLKNIKEPELFLKQIIYHPLYLELIIYIFGYSEYLSNILVIEPDLIYHISNEDILFTGKTYQHYFKELDDLLKNVNEFEEKIDIIRRFKNREIMRIGLRDIYLNIKLEKIVKEISELVDAIVNHIYNLIVLHKFENDFYNDFIIIALGKLGGKELNYSSDIDLVFVFANSTDDENKLKKINSFIDNFIKIITASSQYGQLFRVDTRLRPYGNFGSLFGSFNYYLDYYNSKAAGWELLAWLKARTIAGNKATGKQLIDKIHKIALLPENQKKIFDDIIKMRKEITKKLLRENIIDEEVKLGPGGIRSIEFIVQYYQILNGSKYRILLNGNILFALFQLRHYKILSDDDYNTLKNAYIFLRTIEHRIQMFALQQKHILPEDKTELIKLARRIGFIDRLEQTAYQQFIEEYQKQTDIVNQMFAKIFN